MQSTDRQRNGPWVNWANPNSRNISSQTPNMSQGQGLACIALCFAFINLFFIIPDLVFGGQENQCVTTHVNGIAFPLGTWLKVDGYVRIVLLVFLVIFAIAVYRSIQENKGFLAVFCGVIFLYFLFAVAWAIVGSFMFWQRLNSAGKCSGGVQIYMHIALSINYVFLCCLGIVTTAR